MMKTKHLWLLVAFLLSSTITASAQKKTAMRLEVAEAETDHGDYTIFTYEDEDGTTGYYMSLGKTSDFLGADEILGMKVQNIKETAIWLGSTTDEAFATIDNIMALYDKDVDTTTEFKGRETTAGFQLGEPTTTQCTVVKKTLGGKRLQFLFTMGDKQGRAYLTKSTLKELRTNFKLDVKMHPKQHRKQ